MREITEAHERYRESLERDLLESLKAIKTDQMKVNFSEKNGEREKYPVCFISGFHCSANSAYENSE